jgi:integrase
VTKRRGQGEGSIYKRADGRWVGAVNLGWEAGRRRRKVVYGKTRTEVAHKARQALHAHERGLPTAAGREQTVGAFLNRWLADTLPDTVALSTLESYRDNVRLHIEPILGRIRLTRLTPSDVQGLLSHKLDKGLSPRTVLYLRAILRRALGQAERWGLVARNVAALVDPPKIPEVEQEPYTLEEALRLLSAARGDRLEAVYTVALSIGLRKGETCALRWSDVDLEAAWLRVTRTYQRGTSGARFVEPKTPRSRRTIGLPTVCVEALRAHKARQAAERLAAGSRWQDHGLVFTSTIGTPIEPRNLTRYYEALTRHAGLGHRRFHDLRHTAATLLLAQGTEMRVVMETLGHSAIGTTANLYTHVVPALKREAANRMDALLREDRAGGSLQEKQAP